MLVGPTPPPPELPWSLGTFPILVICGFAVPVTHSTSERVPPSVSRNESRRAKFRDTQLKDQWMGTSCGHQEDCGIREMEGSRRAVWLAGGTNRTTSLRENLSWAPDCQSSRELAGRSQLWFKWPFRRQVTSRLKATHTNYYYLLTNFAYTMWAVCQEKSREVYFLKWWNLYSYECF